MDKPEFKRHQFFPSCSVSSQNRHWTGYLVSQGISGSCNMRRYQTARKRRNFRLL